MRGIYRATLIALVSILPWLSIHPAVAAEPSRFDLVHAEILKVYQFVHNPNGSLVVSDKLRVRQDARFRKDLQVLGKITVEGKLTTPRIRFENTDLTTLDTSRLQPGVVVFDESSQELRLWDGSDWFEFASVDELGAEYLPGSGLVLSGNTFSVDQATEFAWTGDQSWSQGATFSALPSCTALETDANGVLTCGTDDGEAYTAGSGLTLAANEFAVDEAAAYAWTNTHSWSDDLTFSALTNCTALETDGSGLLTCGSDSDTTQTLQTAYDAGGAITTTDAKDIDLTLADTTTDSNLDIDIATDSTSTVAISRLAGAGTGNPNQLLLLEDLDSDLTLADALVITTAGTLTDGIQIGSGAETITNAINIGSTGVTTDLRLQNGATIDNNLAGTVAITADATLLDSALQVGDGVTFSSFTNCALETDGSGVLSCGVDDNEVYTAGSGLTLAANEFAVDEAAAYAWTNTHSWSDDLTFSALTNCTALETDGAGLLTCGSDSDTTQSLQTAYTAGGSIITTDAKDIDITLDNTTTDSNLDIDIATDSSSTVAISRLAGAGTGNPNQLLLLEDLDSDLTIADALVITTAGTLTDGIQIGSGSQAITNAINIGSTGVTTDLRLQNGETIDNNLDGTLVLTVDANGSLTVSGGNLVVGNGTPDLALNGEDAYIEGTLEVDGASQLDGSLTVAGVGQFDTTLTATGAADFDTSITIANGTAISGHLSGSTSFDGASIGAASCGTLGSITVTGAALGDSVTVAPTPATNGVEDLDLSWSAYISAADTVSIRACNPLTLSAQNPSTQTWRADVWKH